MGSFLMFVSCSSSKEVKTENEKPCNENLVFKKLFFEHVQNVENSIYEIQDESFRNSLKFIGKYTHVSFDRMSNYSNSYPDGIFLTDKKIWLKWYEDNRCKNLQLKE